MKKMNIKVIKSRPFHPQSQGKIERLHRQLRQKIMFDLLSLRKNGVNWVKHLPRYATILNEEPREELNWKSAFNIYYGHKSNRITRPLLERPSAVVTEIQRHDLGILPNAKDVNSYKKSRRRLRKQVKLASERCNKRTLHQFTIKMTKC